MDDYKLRLTFTNGQVRIFDVKPYLSQGVFRELRDVCTVSDSQNCAGKHSVEERAGFLSRHVVS